MIARSVLQLVALFVAAVCSGIAAERISFVGVWERAEPMIAEAARQRNLEVTFLKGPDIATPAIRAQASSSRVVFILNIQSQDAAELITWAREAQPRGVRVLALDKRASHFELEKAELLSTDNEIQRYWRANGSVNVQRMFSYIESRYLGRKVKVEPVIAIPDQGYYDPDREEAFGDIASYQTFKQVRGRWREGAPVAVLITQQSFWITRDVKVIDAEVRALERHGVNAVVVFGDRQKNVEELVLAARPELVIEDRHGVMWEDRRILNQLDVPYLRPISMLGYTLDEWRKDPRGLSYRDVGMFMTVQESWGTIEPVLVGGMVVNVSGFRLHEPLPEGVERFAARASAWLTLHRKPNAEKKVAIIYYNKGLGKDDLMRGSPTGAFLDGPESLVQFLPELRRRGYAVDRLPENSAELIGWAKQSGYLVAPWNPGDLSRLVAQGKPVLVPLARYRRWFDTKLSSANRAALIRAYGPPPGRTMTVFRDGIPYIVLPVIRVSRNVILAPQPERGQSQDDKLLHSRDIPPPHNYLAFYWWLQEEFRADAVVHWGTHGSLELLPGKETGMARDDWSDICAGNIPVVNLWIMDNLAEATLSRRRSYAQLVDHMTPPAVSSPLPDELDNLRRDIEKYLALEPGVLREQYRTRISEAAHQSKLDEPLHLQAGALEEAGIRAVADHLNELYENRAPATLHVLGKPPADEDFYPYLAATLGTHFPDHAAAISPPLPPTISDSERRVRLRAAGAAWLAHALSDATFKAPTVELARDLDQARVMAERLRGTRAEVDGLMRALEGRYIQPGPGPDPIHNPDSVPGGRNLYALNPEEVPTKPSWELAVKLVNEMLAKRSPRKVGFDLNGMDTMRDFGVLEAQILYMMGVRPVWDRNNLAIDVELIPRSELKRPRIDVFIALGGLYKENFGSRLHLIDKAVRLVSQLEEPDNGIRSGTLDLRRRLLGKGMPEKEASEFANARIFGTKPGNMSGTNILYLVPRSGVWDKSTEVADVYIDNMSYAYTGDVWGEKIAGLYEESIQGTDTLVRVWASNMTSQLSNHHAYEYLGGLSMAVRQLTGREPDALIADVRNPDGAKMRSFEEVLSANLRTELLNPKWISGMMEHGYAGAGHAAELVKNTFGWSVTRPESVGEGAWTQIYETWVEDRNNLGTRKWMERVNPHALQEMAATMLEATRKGYWKASPQVVSNLSMIYADSVSRHGDSGGLVTGGNTKLHRFVSQELNAPGLDAGAALARSMAVALRRSAARPRSAIASSAAGPATSQARLKRPGTTPLARQALITGQRLVRVVATNSRLPQLSAAAASGSLLFALLLLGAGFIRRLGLLC